MYFLLAAVEILLCAAVIFALAVWADPLPALIISVVLIVCLLYFRPARRLDAKLRTDRRQVLRRFRPSPVPDHITLRPADGLSPAEVFRLMEILRAVPADRLDTADFTATLLDLNRRGLIALTLSDGVDLLQGEGMCAHLRRDLDVSKLRPHERILVSMLKKASGPAVSVRLSAFYDVFTRYPFFSQRKTDAFRRAVDKSLKQRGMLKRVFAGERRFPYLLGRRMWLLTRAGEQSAASWRVYCRNVCTHPFLESYRPNSAEQKKFASEAAQILVDAAACGYCAKAAECLQREYVFDPMEIWHDGQYFSTMTESRTAFSGSKNGEDYFFLPLRDFESAVRTAVQSGTSSGRTGSGTAQPSAKTSSAGQEKTGR